MITKCPKCVEQGKRSKLYGGDGGTRTLMSFTVYHDEDGQYHSHDPNRLTSGYQCSEGHRFSVTYSSACPSCTYGHNPIEVRYFEDEVKDI